MLRFTDPVPEDVASGFWSEGLGRRVLAWMRSIQEAVNGAQGTPDPPSEIQAGATADAGESQAPSPSDHTHGVDTAAPSKVQYTGSPSEGTGTALKRADAREVLEGGVASGDVLVWNGTDWVPSTAVGDLAARIGNAITAGNGILILKGRISGASALSNFLNITGTVPASLSAHTHAALIDLTGVSAAQPQSALYISGPANPSGAGAYGMRVLMKNGSGGNQFGIRADTGDGGAATAILGLAVNGTFTTETLRVGVRGETFCFPGTPQAIGVVGTSATGTGDRIGGWFGYGGPPSSGVTAALVADNASFAGEIFKARDNAQDVFTINDGGGFTLFLPVSHAFFNKFIQSAAQGASITYTLPVDDGVVGAVLSTDGAGVLEWASLDSRVATQFDKTDTALANVTGLTANVKAGRKYSFTATLFFDADVVGGQKWAMGGTATATAIIYQITSEDNAALATVIQSRQTALGGSAGQAGCVAGIATIRGLITVNAAGTLTCQFSQDASSGVSSVLVGSTFSVREVA